MAPLLDGDWKGLRVTLVHSHIGYTLFIVRSPWSTHPMYARFPYKENWSSFLMSNPDPPCPLLRRTLMTHASQMCRRRICTDNFAALDTGQTGYTKLYTMSCTTDQHGWRRTPKWIESASYIHTRGYNVPIKARHCLIRWSLFSFSAAIIVTPKMLWSTGIPYKEWLPVVFIWFVYIVSCHFCYREPVCGRSSGLFLYILHPI